MRILSVLFLTSFLAACATELDTSLQSQGSLLTVLHSSEGCPEQTWSLGLSIVLDEETRVGGQVVIRGMDPVEGLELELMDHVNGGDIDFEVSNEDGYSWHVRSLVVTFAQAPGDGMKLNYSLEMLDGSIRRGSLTAPVTAAGGACL